MLKLDAKTSRELNRFLQWWGSELASLFPDRLREIFSQRRPRLIMSRCEEGIALSLADASGVRELGTFSLDDAGARQRETLLRDDPKLLEAELVLKLAPDQSLQRTIKLPAVAEENLAQVVAFELDRWTPFKAEQAYFGTRVTERLQDTRQIRVELALTPKQKLDPLLDELVATGWRPERVDVGPDPEGRGMDLLPERFRPHRSKLPQLITGIAVGALALTLMLAFALPIYMNKSLAEELQQEVKTAGKVAQEVEALKTEVERRRNEQGFLSRKKLVEPTMLDMMNDLTKVMPDDTWLNGLQYRDRKVTIQGQSPTASSLIEKIEASAFFKNTSFVSPVTKDVASGQERFQIASEVTNGGISEKPTE